MRSPTARCRRAWLSVLTPSRGRGADYAGAWGGRTGPDWNAVTVLVRSLGNSISREPGVRADFHRGSRCEGCCGIATFVDALVSTVDQNPSPSGSFTGCIT